MRRTLVILNCLVFFSLGASGAPTHSSFNEKFLTLEKSFAEEKPGLSLQERQDLFDAAVRHPVADVERLDSQNPVTHYGPYDPTGEVGFCFGRAMAVHLLARKMKLQRDAIQKLFIIGDLRQGPNPEWRFHVTTVVRGAEDRRWYAIDPIMVTPIANGTPLLLSEWVKKVRSIWDRKPDPEKLARLYLVDPEVVLPDITTVPDLEEETGERIIELAFDPAKDGGFDRWIVRGIHVYKVATPAARRFFLGVSPERVERSFDFQRITINGKPYPYHDYFTDLEDNFLGKKKPATLAAESPRPQVRAIPLPGNLRSFRFGLRKK